MSEAHNDLQRLREKKRHKGFHTKGRDYCRQAVDRPTRQGEVPAELDKGSASKAVCCESWTAD